MYNDLSYLEKDALKELFNLSMGRAANTMNEIFSKNIELSIPECIILPREEILKLHNINSTTITSVSQTFFSSTGDEGIGFLVFPQVNLERLVYFMTKEADLNPDSKEIQKEVITEFGNLILNACMGTIANLTMIDFKFNLAEFYEGELNKLVDFDRVKSDFETVLVIYVDYKIENENIEGYLLFLLNWSLIDYFINEVMKTI